MFLLELEGFLPVLMIVVGEHADEGGDLLDGMLGLGREGFLLQTQHHGAIEGVEAGLHLVLVFMGATVAQLDDEGQHLIVLGIVEGELGTGEQLGVELLKLLQGDLVDLQMSALPFALAVHHGDEVAVPVGHVFFLFVGIVETVDVFLAQTGERAVVSADDVFYLPHVEQVFGNAFFT